MRGQAGAQYKWSLHGSLQLGTWTSNVCRQWFGGLLRFAGRFFQLQRTDSFLHLQHFIWLPALKPVHSMTRIQQENGTNQRRCRPYLTRIGRNGTWSAHGRHVVTFWPGSPRLLPTVNYPRFFLVGLVFKLRPSLAGTKHMYNYTICKALCTYALKRHNERKRERERYRERERKRERDIYV